MFTYDVLERIFESEYRIIEVDDDTILILLPILKADDPLLKAFPSFDLSKNYAVGIRFQSGKFGFTGAAVLGHFVDCSDIDFKILITDTFFSVPDNRFNYKVIEVVPSSSSLTVTLEMTIKPIVGSLDLEGIYWGYELVFNKEGELVKHGYI